MREREKRKRGKEREREKRRENATIMGSSSPSPSSYSGCGCVLLWNLVLLASVFILQSKLGDVSTSPQSDRRFLPRRLADYDDDDSNGRFISAIIAAAELGGRRRSKVAEMKHDGLWRHHDYGSKVEERSDGRLGHASHTKDLRDSVESKPGLNKKTLHARDQGGIESGSTFESDLKDFVAQKIPFKISDSAEMGEDDRGRSPGRKDSDIYGSKHGLSAGYGIDLLLATSIPLSKNPGNEREKKPFVAAKNLNSDNEREEKTHLDVEEMNSGTKKEKKPYLVADNIIADSEREKKLYTGMEDMNSGSEREKKQDINFGSEREKKPYMDVGNMNSGSETERKPYMGMGDMNSGSEREKKPYMGLEDMNSGSKREKKPYLGMEESNSDNERGKKPYLAAESTHSGSERGKKSNMGAVGESNSGSERGWKKTYVGAEAAISYDHLLGIARMVPGKGRTDPESSSLWGVERIGDEWLINGGEAGRHLFSSDDEPLDVELREKLEGFSGIEDALLLRTPQKNHGKGKISDLSGYFRFPWQEGAGKKSKKEGAGVSWKGFPLKVPYELLNPMNNPLLQDPDTSGPSHLTRSDKELQKALQKRSLKAVL